MTPVPRIITGEVGCGKTALMRELFRETPAADGLLSEKLFEGSCFRGYQLVRPRNGESVALALTGAAYCGQYEEECRLGPYVFSAEAFRFGRRLLERLCGDGDTAAIFLDEIGPLELAGQGFATVLPALIGSGKELFFTVRSGCLRDFLIKYGIREYRLAQALPCREPPGP